MAQVASQARATAVPQPTAGWRGTRDPDSPAGFPTSVVAAVLGLGFELAVPSRRGAITSRWDAGKRGWQGVRGRRLSAVGVRTGESSGPTTLDWVDRWR